MAIAADIVLIAGGMTFVNQWYQTKEINWKVPLATVLGAAAIDGISHLNDKAGIGLAVMVLIGAATTKFNGKSPADLVAGTFTTSTTAKQPKTHQRGVPV